MPFPSLARLVALAALWGGSFLFMRIVAPVLGAAPTAFWRVVVAAAGLALIVGIVVAPAERSFRGKLGATLVLGAINSGAPFLLFSYAAEVLPAGYSAILNALTPLMGVVIGAAFFAEPANRVKIAGVLVGIAGVAVLTRTGPVEPSRAVWLGVAACLVATVCYGTAGYLTRRWIHAKGGLDSNLVALGSQLGAIAFLAPFMAAQTLTAPIDLASVRGPVWLSLLALGFLCTSLGYVLYFRLIADIGPLRSLSVTFLIPVFGTFWGWLVLGEPVSLAHLAGGGLVGVAVWMVLGLGPPVARSTASP